MKGIGPAIVCALAVTELVFAVVLLVRPRRHDTRQFQISSATPVFLRFANAGRLFHTLLPAILRHVEYDLD
jgi:hypothetical protein